jgi:ankyrin repeat protein
MKYHETKACTPKCRSSNHANELAGLVSRTNDVSILLSGLLQCWNCQKLHDTSGRHLIHVAASYGRTQLVEWLVRQKKADINVKSAESGWTAAHCAIFYGQLDTFILLVKLGANLNKLDYDRLTPVENICLDKWLCIRNEPALWG